MSRLQCQGGISRYRIRVFQILLPFTLQDFFMILGDPNHMILMMVCAVGTEFDLHTYMVSKPPDENLQPSAAGFHPRANARRPQPDFWIEIEAQKFHCVFTAC